MFAGAFVGALIAPVFAQSTQAPAAPAAPTAPAPAPKASAPAATPAPPAAPAAKAAAAKPATKSATGTVKSATAESLVVAVKNKDMTFVLDKDTKITKAGKKAEAKDLAEKDAATVTYVEAEGKMTAKTVTVKAAKKS
jgi:ribosomal protein S1